MFWSSIYYSILSIFLDSNMGFFTTLLKGESEEQETSATKKQPFGNSFMKGPEYTNICAKSWVTLGPSSFTRVFWQWIQAYVSAWTPKWDSYPRNKNSDEHKRIPCVHPGPTKNSLIVYSEDW